MQNLTVAEGSTKFAMLCEWVRKQGTKGEIATRAGVTGRDYERRARELRAADLIELAPRAKGVVFRATPKGRAVCRELKARLR